MVCYGPTVERFVFQVKLIPYKYYSSMFCYSCIYFLRNNFFIEQLLFGVFSNPPKDLIDILAKTKYGVTVFSITKEIIFNFVILAASFCAI